MDMLETRALKMMYVPVWDMGMNMADYDAYFGCHVPRKTERRTVHHDAGLGRDGRRCIFGWQDLEKKKEIKSSAQGS
jgi:hypothetical protein